MDLFFKHVKHTILALFVPDRFLPPSTGGVRNLMYSVNCDGVKHATPQI